MIVIPVFPNESPRWRQLIALGETVYQLTFSWNTRQESWYLSISTEGGTQLVQSIRLVPDTFLLQRYKSQPMLPPGDLVLIDQQNNPKDGIAFTELGSRYILTYLSAEELPDGVR